LKLVRDRIPEIIRKNGKSPATHIASEQEFRHALAEKLLEEAREFQGNPSAEELADVLEVTRALAELHGKDLVEAVRKKKAEERGTFTKRIILHP